MSQSPQSTTGHPDICNPGSSAPDPVVEALVHDIIGKVADRWTMLIIEALTAQPTLRFTQLGKAVGRISQKMLTQTLRRMEQDGLVRRTVHPVIPPHVDYSLTELGHGLAAAFCGVWLWVEANHEAIEQARAGYAATERGGASGRPVGRGPPAHENGRSGMMLG